MESVTKDLRIKPFKMGKFYQSIDDNSQMIYIHSKPRDMNKKSFLLISMIRNGIYEMAVSQGAVFERWEEVEMDTTGFTTATPLEGTRVKPFKMGSYYRNVHDKQVVKYIHGKPRGLDSKSHLLVTIRLPTGSGGYMPQMMVAKGAPVDQWEEIDKIMFERTVNGMEEAPITPAIMNQLILDQEQSKDLNNLIDNAIADISDEERNQVRQEFLDS